jgi:poly [ADP-ribose] polymerase 2/3/4
MLYLYIKLRQLKSIKAIMSRVAKLIMVSDQNNNKFYDMRETGDGYFLVEYGRVGARKATETYPLHKWETKYREKLKKGYKDITDLFKEEGNVNENGNAATTYKEFKTGRPESVKEFVKLLQSYANKSIQQNYTVSSAAVTQKQVDAAQEKLDNIASHLNNIDTPHKVKLVNQALLDLYAIIPRKMKRVTLHLLDETDPEYNTKFSTILDEEQKTLDVMAGQVKLQSDIKKDTSGDTKNDNAEHDLLDAAGLEMVPVTDNEAAMIKGMMEENSSKYLRAFKVVNKNTQVRYDANFPNLKENKTQLFWHGSRNQNWWSIISSGLMIRPSSAGYNGSMFGDGIYGANRFKKSLGYTSYSGSYWAGGNDATAFLALFEFQIGKQHDVHRHSSECSRYNKSKMAELNCDSVYAHKGTSLYNDEFIVYDAAQVTIKYVVQIK